MMRLSAQQIYMIGQGILVGGSAVVMVALPRLVRAWQSWGPASCLPNQCFCEHIHHGQILQPANTWSSFAFVFIGMWILHRLAWEDYLQADRLWREARKHLLVDQAGQHFLAQRPTGVVLRPFLSVPAYGLILGLAVGAVGWFSAVYHATLRFFGQWLDIASMYLLASFVLVYALARRGWLTTRGFILLYTALNLALGIIQAWIPILRRPVFALLVMAALFAEFSNILSRKTKVDISWLWAAFLALLLAAGFWTVDILKIRCEPYSILQGHAIWHLLCAVSAAFLARYYLSEEKLS
jgi:hypothetical protein